MILHLSYRTFKRNLKKFLSFNSKFHRKFVQYFFTKSIYDQGYRFFGIYTSLITVKNLIFSNLASCSFMFYLSSFIFCFYIRKRMSTTFIAHQ